MDYKALLRKYMKYLNEVEGTDYVGEDGIDLEFRREAEIFSEEERKELTKISARNNRR